MAVRWELWKVSQARGSCDEHYWLLSLSLGGVDVSHREASVRAIQKGVDNKTGEEAMVSRWACTSISSSGGSGTLLY